MELTVKRKGIWYRWKKMLKRDWHLILLCVPALIFIFIFDYGPMYGIQIAFKDYNSRKGIWGSEWVGFEHFIRFFNSPNFWNILRNTLSISFYSLLASFPSFFAGSYSLYRSCVWDLRTPSQLPAEGFIIPVFRFSGKGRFSCKTG